MKYYNQSILSRIIATSFAKQDQMAYYKISPFTYANFKSNRDVDLKFSLDDVYISEKEVFFQLVDFQATLKDLGCKVDLSKIEIEKAEMNDAVLKRCGHIVDYKGSFDKAQLKALKKKATKEIKMNPNYSFFKNLCEMKNNKNKCVSIDFEFSPKYGVTEMGATFFENKKLETLWFRVKGTPDRKKPSLFNKQAKMVSINELKDVIKILHKNFDTFIFHDYMAERKIMTQMFSGIKGTPFDGEKKVIDTMRSSLYIRQRDEKYNESGFNDTLAGMCKSMGVKAKGFHNAANDTRFTFNVAENLEKRYSKLIRRYEIRDELNPVRPSKKIKI